MACSSLLPAAGPAARFASAASFAHALRPQYLHRFPCLQFNVTTGSSLLLSTANCDKGFGTALSGVPPTSSEDEEGNGDDGCGEQAWTVHDSDVLYRVHGWGAPYFSINAAGHLCVRPSGSAEGRGEVDMVAVIEALAAQQLHLPLILRFPDILQHRMQELQACFSAAVSKFDYQRISEVLNLGVSTRPVLGCRDLQIRDTNGVSPFTKMPQDHGKSHSLDLIVAIQLGQDQFFERHFQGVFPIKCNPEVHLLDQVVAFGFGLEVGSKPELLIALSKLSSRDGALLICNGYKDSVYVENAVLARKLGIRAVLVLEQMEELEEVIGCSKRLGIHPIIGVRAKLSTKHSGHWGDTSGDNAKFGLTVTEIVSVVYRLKEEGLLDCLELLHFHIGSQISSILVIKEAMREASHTYCELARMGAPMGYIDVGGGLGIDYDGTKGQSSASANYSMQNYANDVVAALMDACLLKGVAEPVIISESGRALASHSSVLVFDVLHAGYHQTQPSSIHMDRVAKDAAAYLSSPSDRYATNLQGEYLLSTFYEVYRTLEVGNAQEAYNDAKQLRQEVSTLFQLGCLSLEQRAQADVLYDRVCQQVLAFGPQLPDELKLSLPSIYKVNLSVFRSAPDSWAISQIFPVMPLQRLAEKPIIQATLADLTCDSDGKIDRFVGAFGEVSRVLPLHALQQGESYYLGLFLGGVYQEVLGSAHNLFGSVHVVHVRALEDGAFVIDHVLKGQSAGQVLGGTYNTDTELVTKLTMQATSALAAGNLSQEEANLLLANYQTCLNSYTYFNSQSNR